MWSVAPDVGDQVMYLLLALALGMMFAELAFALAVASSDEPKKRVEPNVRKPIDKA